MKILVTGATGFLGSHLVEELANNDHHVICLVRNKSAKLPFNIMNNIELIEGLLSDFDSLCQAVSNVDAIIHCAGLTKAKSVDSYYQINTEGTVGLLEAAKKYGSKLRRFVFVSSLAARGPSNESQMTPFIECPVSSYGLSKLTAEQKVMQYNHYFPVTIIRPPLIYGPRDKELLWFFKLAKHGFILLPFGGHLKLSIIYVKDAVSALMKALADPSQDVNIYCLDDGTINTWHHMALEATMSINGRIRLKVSVPSSVMTFAAYLSQQYGHYTGKAQMLTLDKLKELKQTDWVCDSTLTRQQLNWLPQVKWTEGLQLTYKWYKHTGWL